MYLFSRWLHALTTCLPTRGLSHPLLSPTSAYKVGFYIKELKNDSQGYRASLFLIARFFPREKVLD